MGACIRVACTLVRPGKVKGGEEADTELKVVPRPELSSQARGAHANVSQGRVLSGRGAALGTLPISEDEAYLEVVIRTPGTFIIGISPVLSELELHKKPCDGKQSFGLTSDMLAAVPRSGDVIGVYYMRQNGAITLSFALNGLPLGDMYDCPRPGSRTVIPPSEVYYPIAYVSKGAMIEVNMREEDWKYSPFGEDGDEALPEEPILRPHETSPQRLAAIKARLKPG